MKMEQAGIIMSAYRRKMAIDGYVIKLELPGDGGDDFSPAVFQQ